MKKDIFILVNNQDKEIGTCEKLKCHLGKGRLHRAFSIFLFNPDGKLLIQKRSSEKMLWPGYWANSCCSSPKVNEENNKALNRRLKYELGLDYKNYKLKYLFKFLYTANYKNIGTEKECCYVFVGKFYGKIKAHPEEVADYKFVDYKFLQKDIIKNPHLYAPWFKIELKKMKKYGFNPKNLAIKKIK